jgi:hypothetical protein
MLNEINKQSAPKQRIGKFCKKPAEKSCPHIETCWNKPIKKTIYDLPRMSDKKIDMLESIEAHLIEDIPLEFELSDSQNTIVRLIQDRVEKVNHDKLSELLSELKYPIHFFDFETYNPAVPMWNQSKPWQQVPFQYSLHILFENGSDEHYEYLHTDLNDPRPNLISAMQEHLKNTGSVVVYYDTFEKSRLKEMAADLPEHREFLMGVHDRVWDQLDVFKHCFEDYRLALSKSIKVVLPTFIPELSYKTLEVQKGDEAQLEWRNMLEVKPGPKKEQLISNLKEYCKLDTKAMIELHRYVSNLR